MPRIHVGRSNWETVAFLLIRKIIISDKSHFSRSQLMTAENLTVAISFLSILGHKERPDHPEETLQRTIQNLRDKGHIIFHGRGEYSLTSQGISRMTEEHEKITRILNATKDNKTG